MPAPAKAFVDPTAINNRQFAGGFPTPDSPPIPGLNSFVAAPVALIDSATVIPFIPALGVQPIPQQHNPKVPTPPMGRQIVVTFPPVYKERGGGAARPTTGQLWPRIKRNG